VGQHRAPRPHVRRDLAAILLAAFGLLVGILTVSTLLGVLLIVGGAITLVAAGLVLAYRR
jgi:hypothetical protein